MEAIFTATQERRNRKAIAAAIAEHGDTLTAEGIPALADSLAAKYVWEVRRAAYRAEIVKALESHYAGQHGMTKRTEVAAERVKKQRAARKAAMAVPHVMASRAPVATPDLHDMDINPDLDTAVTYTAAPEGMAAVIVSQHVDISEDDAEITLYAADYAHDMAALHDANTEIDRLQDKNIQINRELREARDARLDLELKVKELQNELDELKKEHDIAVKAVDAMSEMQDYDARYGSMLHAAIDRASIGLTCDSWEDPYVRKDITQVIKLAEEYASIIGEEVGAYLQA